MTRKQHLEWAQKRAVEYIDNGSPNEGFSSFVSDMGKHEETQQHVGMEILFKLWYEGSLKSNEDLKKCILDFA